VYVLVLQPTSTPAPLTIAYAPLTERRDTHIITMESIRIVEVLNINHVLSGSYALNNIRVVTDGGDGRIVLDPAQQGRAGRDAPA
jgi:hypothetical protein